MTSEGSLGGLEKQINLNNPDNVVIEKIGDLMDARMRSIFGNVALKRDELGRAQRGLVINGKFAKYLGVPIMEYLHSKGVGYDVIVITGRVSKYHDTVLVEDSVIDFKHALPTYVPVIPEDNFILYN